MTLLLHLIQQLHPLYKCFKIIYTFRLQIISFFLFSPSDFDFPVSKLPEGALLPNNAFSVNRMLSLVAYIHIPLGRSNTRTAFSLSKKDNAIARFGCEAMTIDAYPSSEAAVVTET